MKVEVLAGENCGDEGVRHYEPPGMEAHGQ
jgi:hypothetical protein